MIYEVLIDHWDGSRGLERRCFATEAEAASDAERIARVCMEHKMQRSVWLKRPGDALYGRLVYSWAHDAFYGVGSGEAGTPGVDG